MRKIKQNCPCVIPPYVDPRVEPESARQKRYDIEDHACVRNRDTLAWLSSAYRDDVITEEEYEAGLDFIKDKMAVPTGGCWQSCAAEYQVAAAVKSQALEQRACGLVYTLSIPGMG